MADSLALEVVTPERLVVREEVATVQVPARNGYLGVLPGHAPLLAGGSTSQPASAGISRQSTLSGSCWPRGAVFSCTIPGRCPGTRPGRRRCCRYSWSAARWISAWTTGCG